MLHVSGQGEYLIKTSSITPISPDQCFQKYKELKSIMETERKSSAKKAQDFLPFHQRNRRMIAVVEYVLCGHRCSGRDEPYSNDAIYLMKRKIMQRDVEVIPTFEEDVPRISLDGIRK
ncbi:hypothetical protein Tco_0813653 [Tanacetum coccineum]